MEKKYVYREKEYTRAIYLGGSSFNLTDAPAEVTDADVNKAVYSSLATPYSWAQFSGNLEDIEVEADTEEIEA